MSFNMESFSTRACGCFNNVIAKGKECLTELQENPSEFLRTNVKMVLVATAFFTSLVLAPIFTVGACILGFFYCKNVCKVENEFIDFLTNRSLETQGISAALLASVVFFVGKMVLPIGVGAHVGMLLSNSYELANEVKGMEPQPY
ncbi:MAG: hypothetical protein H0W50_08010 [Parachlamydiaceae bacterium]|nr:hypothetical protein [Parachlamydiaceae bacterium]